MSFCIDLGLAWVMPQTIRDLCNQWKYGYRSLKGKILWKLTLVDVQWSIRIERNTGTFSSKNHYKAVVDSILFMVALWVVQCKEFHGYDVDSNGMLFCSFLGYCSC